MDIPTLTTPRLILRPLEVSDADAVQKIFPQWEVVRFLIAGVPWPYPPDGALRFIRDEVVPAIEQGREWHWSIRLKTSPDQLIGMISLMDEVDNNRGFWLDPAWQRKGLMTEASHEVTRYWFEVLKRPLLRVPKAVPNVPSRRISESSGMRIVMTKEKDYVSGRFSSETWEITADEWRQQRKATSPTPEGS